MSNFKITFDNPWFLFLIIPALALVLWPYFRLSKKYRRTRNRIISMVLGLIVMFLSVNVISGMAFVYKTPNTANEIMLVVDVSYSNRKSQSEKNQFVKSVLDESDSIFQMGIITFAREARYVAKLSADTDTVYRQYENSVLTDNLHDDSATNMAAALNLAKDCFTNPASARIVVISDGVETDGKALSVIMAITSQGIKVDTVLFSNDYGIEVQINAIELPDHSIAVGETVKIGAVVQSSVTGAATLTLYDNDIKSEPILINLKIGVETYYVEHVFLEKEHHSLHFTIENNNDTVLQNNIFYTYLYIEVYEKILILERANESVELRKLLELEFKEVDVLNITDAPGTMRELRAYDQVILMNIANADMPDGFDELLYSYVYDYGGGVLTTGGSKIDDKTGSMTANAYNRDDMMKGRFYRSMLPVNCIDYTPPLALMLVIDTSGSMGAKDNSMDKTRLELARTGAISCLDALSERDYVGLVTFESTAKIDLELTSMTKRMQIEDALYEMESGGGTLYVEALEKAGAALMQIDRVEKKHIMFVTDAEPNYASQHQPWIERLAERGITLSVAMVSSDAKAYAVAEEMAALGRGKVYNAADARDLPRLMREDLERDEIKEYVPEPFAPIVNSWLAEELRGFNAEDEFPLLGGFYGTKAKANAAEVLKDKYVPVYAKWKLGKGRVGSFMSDLHGDWGREFLSANGGGLGVKFIYNAIRCLSPTEDIRTKEIDVEVTQDNYTTVIRVFPVVPLAKGDTVKLKVTEPAGTVVEVSLDESLKYEHIVSKAGTYMIFVEIRNAGDELVSKCEAYSVFSYSDEYNVFSDQEESYAFLENLAKSGKGEIISTPKEVFRESKKERDIIIDPRLAFIITAVILFLLDIAVRKFKFKWPWEMVREHRAKKLLKQYRE